MGKGKFWEAIGGDWYSASLGDLRNVKEDKITLHNAWIHEWGEIDRVMGMQSSEAEYQSPPIASQNLPFPIPC